jgi:hypothetical protein
MQPNFDITMTEFDTSTIKKFTEKTTPLKDVKFFDASKINSDSRFDAMTSLKDVPFEDVSVLDLDASNIFKNCPRLKNIPGITPIPPFYNL